MPRHPIPPIKSKKPKPTIVLQKILHEVVFGFSKAPTRTPSGSKRRSEWGNHAQRHLIAEIEFWIPCGTLFPAEPLYWR